jgi:hypothetical protein
MESMCETLTNVLLSAPCVLEWTYAECASVRHILRCLVLEPRTPEMCAHIDTEFAKLRPRVVQDTRRCVSLLDALINEMPNDDDSEQTKRTAP